MPYRLSTGAVADLEAILIEGITTFGQEQAFKYQISFRHIFELLASAPRLGRRAGPANEIQRRFVHGSHVIFYRIETDAIEIERIIYGPLITDVWGED